MPDELTQNDNPYASPNCSCVASGDPSGQIRPALAPADLFDILIGIVYTSCVLGLLVVGPIAMGLLVYWILPPGQWREVICLLSTAVMLLPTIIWNVWFLRTGVTSLQIDEVGLHFLRRFTRPDAWPWSEVVGIYPATRMEVVWKAWFRPLLFPRERTSCMSALGHYHIQGKTGYCFFPPKSPEAFLEAVARYRPDLLRVRQTIDRASLPRPNRPE